eukprot:TRINITY_DN986_c0_g1_i2.p2 TRINITY_DN986_c0_g1~~TRINITY_DN986_c0_g1_i2.p2  ORF type:complete len:192 (-),score=36.36 TRINITY_DN986_c0_g1_i2:445-1020(-)
MARNPVSPSSFSEKTRRRNTHSMQIDKMRTPSRNLSPKSNLRREQPPETLTHEQKLHNSEQFVRQIMASPYFKPMIVRAKCDFAGTGPKHLSFQCGDPILLLVRNSCKILPFVSSLPPEEIVVKDSPNFWCFGELDGQVGHFPSAFVSLNPLSQLAKFGEANKSKRAPKWVQIDTSRLSMCPPDIAAMSMS